MSFSWIALKRIERLAPELDLVFLMDAPGEWLRARPLARPDWIAGPGIELLREHPKVISPDRGAAAGCTAGRSTPRRTRRSAASSGSRP